MSVLEDRTARAREELEEARAELHRVAALVADDPAWLRVGDPSRFDDPDVRARAESAHSRRETLDETARRALQVEAALDALLADDPGEDLGPGAAVGVLLPVRLETRFTRPVADAEPGTEEAAWWLRIRVEPDPIALAAPAHPSTKAERELVAACWSKSEGELDAESGWTPFSILAGQTGPARAAYLLRTVAVTPDGEGGFVADDPDADPTRTPELQLVGLPRRLEIWAQQIGSDDWELLDTLFPQHEKIATQASFEGIAPSEGDSSAPLPRGWWNSFQAAKDVGLAARVNLGELPDGEQPAFRVVMCVGMDTALGEDGEEDGPPQLRPEELFSAHADAGVLVPLAPLTPTNTVAGEPTVDPAGATSAWFSVSRDAPDDVGGMAWALTGSPLLDGVPGADLSLASAASSLVTALWPVVWQRALKDFLGLGQVAWTLGEWAGRHLAPFGPFPVLRIGDLPYGLLPLTAASPPPWPGEWLHQSNVLRAAEHLAALMATSPDEPGPPPAEDPAALLDLLAQVPTTREYGSRSLPLLAVLALINEAAQTGIPALGDDGLITRWRQRWRRLAMRDAERELAPLGPVLPWPAKVQEDYLEVVDRYLGSAWEELANADDHSRVWRVDDLPPAVLARLVRHSLVLTQAEVSRLIDPDFPDWRERYLFEDLDPRELSRDGGNSGSRAEDLPGNAVAFAQGLADGAPEAAVFRQFEDVRIAVRGLFERDSQEIARALPAVLDCASRRPDAWDTAVAHSRLLRLAASGAEWALGAYGWVDGLRPSPDETPPTEAGLLHAPGYYQALTAAVLRDHAVHPTDPAEADRWSMNLESAGIRVAARLAEDVRLGVHLSEGLGREIERRLGEPGRVQDLRRAFPARPEWAGRRVCDGQRVLDATGPSPQAAEAALVPDWLQPLAGELFADLRRSLDTYADLLVADAMHDVVGGRMEAAAEALQASAGLGAPPQLRMLRTQREAGTVKTKVCVATRWEDEFEQRTDVEPGTTVTNATSPTSVVDPALLELLDVELGAASAWTWTASGTSVSLDDLELGVGDLVILGPATVRQLAVAALPAEPDGGTADSKLETLELICGLLSSGPRDPGDAADLERRLTWVRAELQAVAEALEGDPAELPAALVAARRFGVVALAGTSQVDAAADAARTLRQRLSAASGSPAGADDLAAAIRGLLAPALGLPLICPATQPPVTADPDLDREWLEVVAAVRSSLARLELLQLTTEEPWIAATDAPPGTIWDPPVQEPNGREGDRAITVVYRSSRQQLPGPGGTIGLSMLDSWAETVPSRHHTTWTAFGFDAPRARAPQAVLLGLPPDPSQVWTTRTVRDVVAHARELTRARAVRVPLADPFPVGVPAAIALDTGAAACSLFGEAP